MKALAKTKERASALVITLLVIFLITIAIGIAMNMTTVTVRQTDSSRDFSALRSAAEGAVDFGYGVWVKKINTLYRPVSNSELTAALGTVPPAFSPFSYASTLKVTGTDQYGSPTTASGTPAPTRINLSKYPGWVGRNTGYLASARMTGTFLGGRTAQYGVKRAINYTVVPLFQATAFFEDTLELYKTAPMTIGGLVHTNSKAFVSSSSVSNPSLTFTGNLSYVGGYVDGTWVDSGGVTRDAPPEAWNWDGYTPNSSFPPAYTNGGIDQQAHSVDRIEPLGSDSSRLLRPPVFNSAGNPTGDLNPNDDTMREMIELPNTYVNPITKQVVTTSSYTDPQVIADRRLYNKAGIRVRVSGSNYTVTTANGTTLTTRQVTALKAALSQQTITDRREATTVDLTTLDVSKAKATITSGGPNEVGPLVAPSFNNIIYIYDDGSTGSDPKGIRLINGSVLPAEGLTVASQNPVYIQGDYNTTNASTRGSAAVFADAVTILSNNWSDGNSSAGLSSRNASETTVNTAIVAGFLPSAWTNPATGAEYGYSGGLNNFPRFLEDWNNTKFYYTGSMIELFTSQIATGEWDTGSIYSPPDRIWNFDSNFVDNPPPGSLDAVSIARGLFVRF